MRDVSGYLKEQQSQGSAEIVQEWTEIEELYNKKLWHQLTEKLLVFVKNQVFAEGNGLLQMYECFIADFEHRINLLSLTEIALIIIKQFKEESEAVEFLNKLKEKVKDNVEATVLSSTVIAMIMLKTSDLQTTKKLVDECQALLDNIDGVTTVHGRFYDLSSTYYKIMGNHANYYRDALRFLGCMSIDDLPEDVKKERAFNLCLAALLGDGIYNFGELLAHPILDSLKGTDKNWLVDLLYAFNSGNLDRFEELSSTWKQQPDLAVRELNLRQKICLLCLMEMTFTRPANNRSITFQEIADATKLEMNEVEILVMKALSLGLVKGSIDQVDAKVHMTWVQPRVLDKQQISIMQERLVNWCEDVKSMQNLVEVKAHDILDKL
ncbi:26S proteasome non-ATPase regulatory subunit 13-like isoform X2 [Anneissia japonica]|uniref:26S proteasome non-ATPase regulatory subunit 13-like isoform X1 n=1 Tax=Anneissia japonica TaxID=1529436 RepID=UPI001425A271|nr:26S proteasome non-ATPase regulatory subunit 13-like isoform X1 [Anneissia japonica]XP_033101353.1 26S proteasome non-ATPase regulatory subunit 13-like isoform X2 [Anneissia japonica]